MNEGEERRVSQDEIIQQILAHGGTYAEAGEAAGVSQRTVRRRMADPDFAKEIAVLRAERVGELTGELVEVSRQALHAIRDCLDEDLAAVRLRAADLILGHMSKLRREHDVDARLAAIEEKLQQDANAAAGGRS